MYCKIVILYRKVGCAAIAYIISSSSSSKSPPGRKPLTVTHFRNLAGGDGRTTLLSSLFPPAAANFTRLTSFALLFTHLHLHFFYFPFYSPFQLQFYLPTSSPRGLNRLTSGYHRDVDEAPFSPFTNAVLTLTPLATVPPPPGLVRRTTSQPFDRDDTIAFTRARVVGASCCGRRPR